MRSLVKQVSAVRKINSLYYYHRVNRWRWHWRFRDDPRLAIDRPVFLLGTQGGGLTLLSRILHRHPNAISVTGNAHYWAGADETQNVLARILPELLGWREIRLDGYDTDDHNWLYANNDFLPHYRQTATAAEKYLKSRYKCILRSIIRLNALGSMASSTRFIDKSQSLTLRVALVHSVLRDCDPKFVLLTRNPFAIVWRAASKDRNLLRIDKSIEARVRLATEHWKNSMECALTDAKDSDVKLKVWRFEDLLTELQKTVQEICSHIELPFEARILPSAKDVIPWGSMYDAFDRRKWYPLRANVNDKYLAEIPPWARYYIEAKCGNLIKRFGYTFKHDIKNSVPQESQ